MMNREGKYASNSLELRIPDLFFSALQQFLISMVSAELAEL